jgi:hypothetical protein
MVELSERSPDPTAFLCVRSFGAGAAGYSAASQSSVSASGRRRFSNLRQVFPSVLQACSLLIFFIVSFVTACSHLNGSSQALDDAKLQQKLVGTWGGGLQTCWHKSGSNVEQALAKPWSSKRIAQIHQKGPSRSWTRNHMGNVRYTEP